MNRLIPYLAIAAVSFGSGCDSYKVHEGDGDPTTPDYFVESVSETNQNSVSIRRVELTALSDLGVKMSERTIAIYPTSSPLAARLNMVEEGDVVSIEGSVYVNLVNEDLRNIVAINGERLEDIN